MIASKKKTSVIEVQLKEFEDKLRRQLLKEKLASMAQHSEHADGVLPTIHVSLGQLAASRPPVRPGSHASGD